MRVHELIKLKHKNSYGLIKLKYENLNLMYSQKKKIQTSPN